MLAALTVSDSVVAYVPGPFVVRASSLSEWCLISSARIRSQLSLERSVHGYGPSGTEHVSGRVALSSWDQHTLHINIVDSECKRGSSVLLPDVMRQRNEMHHIDTAYGLAYVLSAAPCVSRLHVDPPHGAPWQYLATGSKT